MVGAGIRDRGGSALVYRSSGDSLRTSEYQSRLCTIAALRTNPQPPLAPGMLCRLSCTPVYSGCPPTCPRYAPCPAPPMAPYTPPPRALQPITLLLP